MIKRLSPQKLNKDISPDKYKDNFYYDARNVRIISGDSNTAFSVTNEKGNKLVFTIPDIENEAGQFRITLQNQTLDIVSYTNTELNNIPNLSNLKILKFVNIGDRLFVTTCSNNYGQLWEVTTQLELKYNNLLNWSLNKPIRKIIGYYENSNNQKLYFTDNNNYLRFFNVEEKNLIDKPINQIDAFPDHNLAKPQLTESFSGGNFKPGYVQYAYNLYDLNGTETKLSPFSDMININPDTRGGEADEKISKAFKLKISNIDKKFKTISVYKFYYTNANSTPKVTLLFEENIEESFVEFIDDNNLQESNDSLENVLFLGTDPFKCKDIDVKDNHLFPVNVTYDRFDVDFETRAFSFDTDGDIAKIKDQDNNFIDVNNTFSNIPEFNHDCINPSLKTENGDLYDKDYDRTLNSEYGAEGPNIKLNFIEKLFKPDKSNTTPNSIITEDSYVNPNSAQKLSLKRDEVYRFFIRFKNKKGQKSFAKWVADLRVPNQDVYPITKMYNNELHFSAIGLNVEVKNLPNDVVSWEILRETRDVSDRTIVAQGFLNSMINTPSNAPSDVHKNAELQPSYITRTWHNDTVASNLGYTFKDNRILSTSEINNNNVNYRLYTWALQFHSPELENKENFNTFNSDYLNFIGGIEQLYSTTYYTQNVNKLEKPEQKITGTEYFGTNPFIISGITIPFNNTIYQSVIRKGGLFNGVNPSKIDILGKANYSLIDSSVDNSIEQSYDNGIGFQTYVNTNYLEDYSDNVFRAQTNSNLTFQIGWYNSNDGLESKISSLSKETNGKFVICDYKRLVTNQYGGNTYEARLKNKPVVISDTVTGTGSTEVFNGDTYVCYWNYLRSAFYSNGDEFSDGSFSETLFLPVETNINIDLRPDDTIKRESNLKKVNQLISSYELPLDVYNRQKEYNFANPKPLNFQSLENYNVRVLASDKKVNGEFKDSWLRYRENNFLDVEGKYNEIVAIIEDRNQLFVFQKNGICQLQINPNVQTQSGGIEVELGKGTLLYDYQYISTTSGTENQFGICTTPFGIFYYDHSNKTLSLLNRGEKPISLQGMYSYFLKIDNSVTEDNPYLLNGISSYHDNNKKETFITFFQKIPNTLFPGGFEYKKETVSYSHLLEEGFHTIWDWGYPTYINHNGNIYSGRDSKIYQHNIGEYGRYNDNYTTSSITFIVNFNYINSIIDSLTYNSIVGDDLLETVSGIRIYNEHQDTGLMTPDAVRKYRKWRIKAPRQQNTRNRIQSNYVYMTIEFKNNNNKKLILQDIIVNYRSKPHQRFIE